MPDPTTYRTEYLLHVGMYVGYVLGIHLFTISLNTTTTSITNTCLAALKQNVHWPLLSKATLPLVDGLNDHVVSCYITKGELGRYRQLCSTDGGQKKCERFPIDFRANFPLADYHTFQQGGYITK
ncbi:hypothetical protein ALC56_07237 [Trachymyrmex septentrionalis]|uniref:Uncharacterized protein n=1 Tax=Trachymyrmex septentrionalis TaxID=34720 RepID=A0A195FDB9_9HYME|nr:hypothetical protein ALC56_07237 [Trachymyrmex septentrionalis]